MAIAVRPYTFNNTELDSPYTFSEAKSALCDTKRFESKLFQLTVRESCVNCCVSNFMLYFASDEYFCVACVKRRKVCASNRQLALCIVLEALKNQKLIRVPRVYMQTKCRTHTPTAILSYYDYCGYCYCDCLRLVMAEICNASAY